MAVGIDLGTSNSCVAIARNGRLDVLANAYGERICPSVVHFAQDGSTRVGQQAKAHAIHDPEHTITSAKRLMGRYYFSEEVKKAKAVSSYQIVEGPNHAVRIKVRDAVLAIPEVSAIVLREMKQVAETSLGQPVNQAVITVPAYFNDNQRQATRDAGRIAGLEVLRLLNEPTAAALAYGFGKGLAQRVAVYDLGGGTFDISILEIGSDVFEVLSTCGDTFLGGEDFDDRVIDWLADEFLAKHKINLRHDRFALEKLKAAAEQAKKTLSVDDAAAIQIRDVAQSAAGGSLHVERTLSREEFAGLVGDLVQRTFKVCDEALQQANLTVRDLDGVILVGGPTRLPLIRDAVSQYFQREPKAEVDPDQVVAMGAAIHAAALVGEERDSCLLDVTPLSLRIGVAGGLAETVIERNTPVPIEQTSVFTTFRDYQQSVRIRVYQGESRSAEQNELLGEFEFSGFKNARRGEVRIDVTFEIDTDGIVNVTARDPDTGQAASTQIHLSSGLSEEEIRKLVEKHQTEAAAVPEARPRPALPPRRAPARPPAAAPPLAEPADDDLAPLEIDPETIAVDDGEAFGLDTGAVEADAGGEIDPAQLQAEPAQPAAADDAGGPLEIDPEAVYDLDSDGGLGDAGAQGPVEAGGRGEATEFDPGQLDVDAVAEAEPESLEREIDLAAEPEPAGASAADQALAAIDAGEIDPLAVDLDEADLDSLVEMADDATVMAQVPPGAVTRPRPEGSARGSAPATGDLFDEPGTDLSQYHDDGEPPRGES
jgi:molecular chaperone DnaK